MSLTTSHPPQPLAPDLRNHWMLEEGLTFLNHGSFGSLPRVVFEEQTRWRQRIEADPIELLGRQCVDLVAAAKPPLAALLKMPESDFVFVTNATEGVNAVLRSLPFTKDDELVTTSHAYGAVRQAIRYAADRSGASFRQIDIPLPIASAGQIEQLVIAGLTDKTRLLIIDHVTSPTALVFPIERIVAACSRRGIDVLVDGAHGPGMLDLDIPRIGAAYYTGNLHKWPCCPKGSAFLYVRPDRQALIHPPVISHLYGNGFQKEFSWNGTRDITAWLCVPKSLEFMARFGWQNIIAHNHAMAVWVDQMLCQRWGVEPISPADGSLLGSMASVPLPAAIERLPDAQLQKIQPHLYEKDRIEVSLGRSFGRVTVRPCCQIYNTPADYVRLADAISRIAASV